MQNHTTTTGRTEEEQANQAKNADQHRIAGLAGVLVGENLISSEMIKIALEDSKKEKTTLVTYLVEHDLVDDLEIAKAASRSFGVPLIDLEAFNQDHMAFSTLKDTLITRYNVLPLYNRGNSLFLVVDDPSAQEIFDEIKFSTGLMVKTVVAPHKVLLSTIEAGLKAFSASNNQSLDELIDDQDLEQSELEITSGEETNEDEASGKDDAPVVKYVQKILLDSIAKGASDIHFEPYEKKYRVRFRLDGVLQEIASPPVALASRITARLKIISQLDISERRVPQDGRFKIKLSATHEMDFRISTCPTVNGEKVVIRLLDPSASKIGIDALGFEPAQKERFENSIAQPQGMVLVTGPTGSGKTVTLYTALNLLNTGDKNISTAEDPVEIRVPGINQVNINNKTGLDFSAALKSFLRQDPDIIMVGEMRDLETAEIGIKAAQTGHLMLSTLHTNSAAETITRLVNMGVAPFNIATSLSMVIAQRLARRLCSECKEVRDLPPETLLEEGFTEEEMANEDFQIFKANEKGCKACNNGYKGRVGIYEALLVSPAISELILTNASSLDIKRQAELEGMNDLRRSGLNKVLAGLTSLKEVNRVTKG